MQWWSLASNITKFHAENYVKDYLKGKVVMISMIQIYSPVHVKFNHQDDSRQAIHMKLGGANSIHHRLELQNLASLFPLNNFPWAKNSSYCFIENLLQSFLSQCRAFWVLHCSDFFRHLQTECCCDRLHFLLLQFFDCFFIITKIQLCADQNYRSLWTMMADFRVPLKTITI